MKADRVEISWDANKSKWLVRVEVGAEVIRRYCDKSKTAGEEDLRAMAAKTTTDEGYEFEPANITIRR
jgi:hypothetical protein